MNHCMGLIGEISFRYTDRMVEVGLLKDGRTGRTGYDKGWM